MTCIYSDNLLDFIAILFTFLIIMCNRNGPFRFKDFDYTYFYLPYEYFRTRLRKLGSVLPHFDTIIILLYACTKSKLCIFFFLFFKTPALIFGLHCIFILALLKYFSKRNDYSILSLHLILIHTFIAVLLL